MRPLHLALVCWLLGLPLGAAQGADKEAADKPYLVFDAGGHTATVRKVLFTPDGEQVITISQDKTVRVWDVLTGEPLQVLRVPVGPGDEGSLEAAALSADGKTLAVSGLSHGLGKFGVLIYLISLESGQVERVLKGHTGFVAALAFSPDGKWLASGSDDKTVHLVDAKTGRIVKKLEGSPTRITALAFSPDSQALVTSGPENTARLWSLDTGKSTAELKGHVARINAVAWAPDGKTVATGSTDGTIRTWDRGGKFQKSYLDPTTEQIQVTSISFRGDAPELLYTGIGNTGRSGLINLNTGRVRITFPGHNNTVMSGALSRDGKRAVTAGGDDHETFVWKTENAAVVQKFQGKGRTVWGVGWSADGQAIAWGHTNRGKPHLSQTALEHSFRLNQLEFGQPPDATYRRGELSRGKYGLELGKDFQLVIKNGDSARLWKTVAAGDRVYCFTMVDDQRAAVGTGFALYLVDLETHKVVRTFQGHTSGLMGVAMSPDGRYLLSGGRDQTLRIWDPQRDEPLLSLFVGGTEWVAWTPEGYYAASAYGERLMGWLVNKGPEVLATYFPAVQFRKSLYQPQLIRKLTEAGSVAQALVLTGKDKQPVAANVAAVLPPEVVITAPAAPSGTRINNAKLEVKATAKSVGAHPVLALRLLVDGRPYKGQAGQRSVAKPRLGAVSESWTVELTPGKHTFAVQAESAVSKGLSSFVEVTRAGANADLPALYVLTTGVSAYPGRLQLHYAAADADALAAAFQKNTGKAFRKVEVKVLTDKNAKRQDILDGLAWLAKQMTPLDVAVFSFSGHGTRAPDGRFFFLPVDVNVDDIPKSCVSGEVLKKALADVPGRLIVILDACHSGATAEGERAPSTDDLARDLVTDDYGVITLCSSLGREYSLEGPDVKQGYFTYALIEGLSGKADANSDRIVHLSELEHYATLRVPELTRGEQHPVSGKPASMRSFPLAVR